MSEYSEEEKIFIVCTFYETGDSHSETIERFVERFGPEKVPTGETIDRIADEFETSFKESEARNDSRTAPTTDNKNQATNILENEPELEHNEISKRPSTSTRTSTGTHNDIKQKSPVLTKRKRNKAIKPCKTIRTRVRQQVADLLATGLTQDEIAEKIGISKDLVSTIIAVDLAAELPARRTKKTRTSDEKKSVTVTTETKPSTTQADKTEKIKVSTSKANVTKDNLSKKQKTRKTSKKNEIAQKAGPSTSTDNDNVKSDPSERPEASKDQPKKPPCGLHSLKKLIESNDQQEIKALAEYLGVPKECIDHVRRTIGFGSHFPKK